MRDRPRGERIQEGSQASFSVVVVVVVVVVVFLRDLCLPSDVAVLQKVQCPLLLPSLALIERGLISREEGEGGQSGGSDRVLEEEEDKWKWTPGALVLGTIQTPYMGTRRRTQKGSYLALQGGGEWE